MTSKASWCLLLITPVLHKTSAIGMRTLQISKEYEAPKLTNRSKKTIVSKKSVIQDKFKVFLTSYL